jgi:hypothetical protein
LAQAPIAGLQAGIIPQRQFYQLVELWIFKPSPPPDIGLLSTRGAECLRQRQNILRLDSLKGLRGTAGQQWNTNCQNTVKAQEKSPEKYLKTGKTENYCAHYLPTKIARKAFYPCLHSHAQTSLNFAAVGSAPSQLLRYDAPQ